MKSFSEQVVRWTSAVCVAVVLTSCGGGGGTAPPEVINGIAVPVDPGTLGQSTLAGIDINSNGVRDDVERVLAQKVGTSATAYARGMSAAASLQAVVVNGSTVEVQNYMDTAKCAPTGTELAVDTAEQETLNNRARQKKLIDAYLALIDSVSSPTTGSVSSTPCL
jgi:hypothetical protein